MSDPKRTTIAGKAVTITGNDIDTDRIIPARFLRCVTFDGLGEHAFEDDRKQLSEGGEQHPFDDPARAASRVLVVNANFGCGSSREHAPQALMRWNDGISAIVGESFAEIFFGNCVALGIPCVTASPEDVRTLQVAVAADAGLEVTVDLEAKQARFGDHSIAVDMPGGARGQLLSGRWDSTAELLDGKGAVSDVAKGLPYFAHWK
ncbi:MAG: 3-isopropylmalate dehydratase small subunit [Myxococcales bacterium]|nr:3-isopropylmalate dehydratase small subunit [Myxococcales bacterium]